MSLPIFDAHCDTVLRLVDDGAQLLDDTGGGHVHAPGLAAANVRCQVFACFASLLEHGDQVVSRSRQLLAAASSLHGLGPFVIPGSAAELAALEHGDRVGVLLAMEGGEGLGGAPEAVAEVARLGVRCITLAWGDNELTGSAFGDGTAPGLSGLGREVVAEMERLRVLVDVSHISDRAFEDLLAVARRPMVASHSNCRALCDVPRNLTDDQLRAVAASGGVVGINLVSGFLTNEAAAAQRPILARRMAGVLQDPGSLRRRMRLANQEIAHTEMPPLSSVADHIQHAVQVAGIDAVGLGSDFDGFAHGPQGLKDCRDYPKIVQLLSRRGFTGAELEKLCWHNWMRLFGETFGA